jgi:hypothetical protein
MLLGYIHDLDLGALLLFHDWFFLLLPFLLVAKLVCQIWLHHRLLTMQHWWCKLNLGNLYFGCFFALESFRADLYIDYWFSVGHLNTWFLALSMIILFVGWSRIGGGQEVAAAFVYVLVSIPFGPSTWWWFGTCCCRCLLVLLRTNI